MDPNNAVRLDPRLATRLAEKKARLDRLRPLPPAVVQRLADDMRVLLTYHSNAIEGNTLSLYRCVPLGAKAQRVYAWDEARRFSGFSPEHTLHARL